MKGQSQLEYIVAMVIFVTITIFVTLQIAKSVPYYHTNSLENRLNNDCLRISENMIKDSKLMYGFAKRPYELNYTKLYEFNDTCDDISNYDQIKNNMSLEAERDFQLKVQVQDSSGSTIFSFVCGRKYVPSQSIVATVERHAITDGNSTKIILNVW